MTAQGRYSGGRPYPVLVTESVGTSTLSGSHGAAVHSRVRETDGETPREMAPIARRRKSSANPTAMSHDRGDQR